MSQPMRLEGCTQVDSHHLIHTALQNASGCQVLEHNPVGKDVHITPVNPRSTSCQDCTVCPQHGIVNNLLGVSEFPIDRPTAGDIRAVAAVLSSKVKEHHVSILDCLVVSCPSMTIMQNCPASTTSRNAVVAHMPCTTVEIYMVEESGLSL